MVNGGWKQLNGKAFESCVQVQVLFRRKRRYCSYKTEIADHGLYSADIVGKDPVFFCKTYLLSYELMRAFQDGAAA
jgi:hypothetical protein